MIDSMDRMVRPHKGTSKRIEFPTGGAGLSHNHAMGRKTVRSLLADAINDAIKSKRTSHLKIVRAKIVSNGALGRLRHCEDNVGIDTLDNLASHLRCQAWQLIHPDFAPAGMPNLSEEALDLALALEGIKDPGLRAKTYAVAMQIVALNPIVPGDTGAETETPSHRPTQKRVRTP